MHAGSIAIHFVLDMDNKIHIASMEEGIDWKWLSEKTWNYFSDLRQLQLVGSIQLNQWIINGHQ